MPGTTGMGDASVSQHEGRVPILAGVLGPGGHRSARGGQSDPVFLEAPCPLDFPGFGVFKQSDAHSLGHAEKEGRRHLSGIEGGPGFWCAHDVNRTDAHVLQPARPAGNVAGRFPEAHIITVTFDEHVAEVGGHTANKGGRRMSVHVGSRQDGLQGPEQVVDVVSIIP